MPALPRRSPVKSSAYSRSGWSGITSPYFRIAGRSCSACSAACIANVVHWWCTSASSAWVVALCAYADASSVSPRCSSPSTMGRCISGLPLHRRCADRGRRRGAVAIAHLLETNGADLEVRLPRHRIPGGDGELVRRTRVVVVEGRVGLPAAVVERHEDDALADPVDPRPHLDRPAWRRQLGEIAFGETDRRCVLR